MIAPTATAAADLKRCLLSTSKCSMKDISSAEPSFVLRLNNAMEMKNTGYKSRKMRLRKKKENPARSVARSALPTKGKKLIVDRGVRRNLLRWARRGAGSRRRFPIVIRVIFYLPLYIVFRVFEFADAATKATHQLGNLFTTKQQEHYTSDQNNVHRTE